MKKAYLVVLFCSVLSLAYAGEPADLGRIVVTPYRYEESLGKTTSNVTVIDGRDILESGAMRMIDIFRTIPGVSVRDYYGNGTKAVADVAGFGEQASLNVLVLVDGRRVNDVDLGGVDWGQVPLDQIERIEFMQSGQGAVLYGDNASSGVINIITKQGGNQFSGSMKVEYGSYSYHAEKLSLGGKHKDLSYWLNAGYNSTNGYRRNSFSKAKDFSGKGSYKVTDRVSMHMNAGVHDASFGIPGALFPSNIEKNGRRFARFGRDHANSNDQYYLIGVKTDFVSAGVIDMDISYRLKNVDSYFLTSTNPTRKNKAQTFGFTPKYTLEHSLYEHENRLVTGLDLYRVLYESDNYHYSSEKFLNYTNINKTSLGVYVQDELSLTDKLVWVNGYRQENARYAFNYHDLTGFNPDQDIPRSFDMRLFNSGISYNYKEDSNVFFNTGKSFRLPCTDEFTYTDASWQQQLDTTLKPQSSRNYEAGVRHKVSDGLNGTLSFFRMNVQDEIYLNYLYDANGSKNENYDKTVHQGAVSSVEAKFGERLTMFGQYTYTDAYFNGGAYNKNEIPSVSRHKARVGAHLLLVPQVTWSVTETYTGDMYALNDQANAQRRVNNYVLTDTALLWKHKDVTARFGIGNVFNKEYAEYTGYDRWSGNMFYFPSPGRNYNMSVEYKW